MEKEVLTLKEVCEKYHISRRAIQGYESHKLVSCTSKNKYGHLLYDKEAQERIQRIKLYQDFGFSLKEIKIVFTLSSKELKKQLIQKRTELLMKQTTLELTLNILQDLIDSL